MSTGMGLRVSCDGASKDTNGKVRKGKCFTTVYYLSLIKGNVISSGTVSQTGLYFYVGL